MSYRTRIYNKPPEHVLLLPEAASSFAEILCKYTLESKATTPNSSRCLLLSVPSWTRGAQLHGSMLSVLSVCLSVFTGAKRMFSDVSKLSLVWMHTDRCGRGCCAHGLFSKDSRHWFGLSTSDRNAARLPLLPCLSPLLLTPNLKTKGGPGTPSRREDVHPADNPSSGTSVIHSPIPRGHSTHEDVQKERMSHYSHVQRRALHKLIKKWQSFLPLL